MNLKTLQLRQVKRTPQNSINELIIWKKNPLVVESEIYIYQQIQLKLNNKFINGILGDSLDLAWLYIMNSVYRCCRDLPVKSQQKGL